MSITFEPAALDHPDGAAFNLSSSNGFELLRRLGLPTEQCGAVDTATLRAAVANALNAIEAAHSNADASLVTVDAPNTAVAADTMSWLDSHTDLGSPDLRIDNFIECGRLPDYFRTRLGWLLETADHADALDVDVQWG